MYLMINGIIPRPWTDFGTYRFSDTEGNTFTLPTTSLISMIFSLLSMFKALVEFNIVNVHVSDINGFYKIKWVFLSIMDHLTFFVATTMFRIMTLVLLLTYLGIFAGFIPILSFMIVNLIYGYYKK